MPQTATSTGLLDHHRTESRKSRVHARQQITTSSLIGSQERVPWPHGRYATLCRGKIPPDKEASSNAPWVCALAMISRAACRRLLTTGALVTVFTAWRPAPIGVEPLAAPDLALACRERLGIRPTQYQDLHLLSRELNRFRARLLGHLQSEV